MESPTTRLRLTSTKSGIMARPGAREAVGVLLLCERRAGARLVAGVDPRGARDAQTREAMTGGALAARRAVALGAALTADGPGQAAEPFARGRAPVRAAAALLARLALVVARDVVAEGRRREARIAGPAAAADAAGDGAERDVRAGQPQARSERAGSQELEELPARRPAGEHLRGLGGCVHQLSLDSLIPTGSSSRAEKPMPLWSVPSCSSSDSSWRQSFASPRMTTFPWWSIR